MTTQPKPATKDQLRAEIATLRSIGGRMSNICFNLAQSKIALTPEDRKMMDQLRRAWDAIPRSEKR